MPTTPLPIEIIFILNDLIELTKQLLWNAFIVMKVILRLLFQTND